MSSGNLSTFLACIAAFWAGDGDGFPPLVGTFGRAADYRGVWGRERWVHGEQGKVERRWVMTCALARMRKEEGDEGEGWDDDTDDGDDGGDEDEGNYEGIQGLVPTQSSSSNLARLSHAEQRQIEEQQQVVACACGQILDRAAEIVFSAEDAEVMGWGAGRVLGYTLWLCSQQEARGGGGWEGVLDSMSDFARELASMLWRRVVEGGNGGTRRRRVVVAVRENGRKRGAHYVQGKVYMPYPDN